MRSELRESTRQQYGFRCGYCGVRETDVGARLTIDHFQPREHGGADYEENLVYCCHACNEFKGHYWQPDSERRILHPLRDTITDHIREDTDWHLVPLTETGHFHIERLHLNREELVIQRRRRQRAARRQAEQTNLLLALRRIESEVQTLIEQVTLWEIDQE